MSKGPMIRNCYFDVSRARYDANLQQTGLPQPNLTMVPGNIQPMSAADYMLLGQAPEPAMHANYVIEVGSEVDIVAGDLITAIWKRNKKTPYEAAKAQVGDSGYGNVVWWVRYHEDNEPGFIETRSLYCERVVVGGPNN